MYVFLINTWNFLKTPCAISSSRPPSRVNTERRNGSREVVEPALVYFIGMVAVPMHELNKTARLAGHYTVFSNSRFMVTLEVANRSAADPLRRCQVLKTSDSPSFSRIWGRRSKLS
jgi:hypothetical protein